MTSKEIKEFRISLNIGQRDFAKMLGVHSRTVQNWESDEGKISDTARLLLERIMKEKQQANSDVHDLSHDKKNKINQEAILAAVMICIENEKEAMGIKAFSNIINTRVSQRLNEVILPIYSLILENRKENYSDEKLRELLSEIIKGKTT